MSEWRCAVISSGFSHMYGMPTFADQSNSGCTAHHELSKIQEYKKYGTHLRGFLLAFRRATQAADPPFELQDTVMERALSLYDHLSTISAADATSADTQKLLQRHIRDLFDYPTPDVATNAPLVVMTYLVSIRQDSGMLLPPHMTTRFTSAYTWLGRVAALVEIANIYSDPKCRKARNLSEIADEIVPSVQNGAPTAFTHMRS